MKIKLGNLYLGWPTAGAWANADVKALIAFSPLIHSVGSGWVEFSSP